MVYEITKADILKDMDGIIEFWNSQNNNKIDRKFDWIYRMNPDGKATTFLVKHSETPEYVGMASIFPRKFAYKDNLFTAGIVGDFFIHSKHRSFGPALMLIRAIASALDESALDFLYTLPNEKAEPIFKRAEYRYLGSTKKYTRLFDIQRLLIDRTHIPQRLINLFSPIADMLVNINYPDFWTLNLGRFKGEISNTLNFDIDHLLDQYHMCWFTSKKTRRYLAWKYEDDPDDKNLFFYIKNNFDQVVGCIVFCFETPKIVQIREILHTEDQYTLQALISLFFKVIKRDNCEYAYAQIFENSGLLRSYNNLDLTVSEHGRKIFYIVNQSKPTSEKLSNLILSPEFCLMKSDEDS